MSRGTLEVAREAMQALSAQDYDRMVELSDPAVEWHSFFAHLGEGGVYRGPEGMRHYVADLRDAFEIVHAEIEDALAVGEVALLIGRIHFRGRDSGVEVALPAGWVLKVRDEKIVYFRAFREPEKVIGEIGQL